MTHSRRFLSAILFTLAIVAILALAARCDRATRPKARPTPEGETRLTTWVTGYTFWDNDPPGSAIIALPVVHDEAGGAGTWDDPVTIAVGYTGETWHYPPGTRFYLPRLKKYAVVEDMCATCGGGYEGHPHVDIYIGGAEISPEAADACARTITAVQEIVIHPAPDYPVHPGELAMSGCRVF